MEGRDAEGSPPCHYLTGWQTLTQDRKQTHNPHTAERTKPLKSKLSSERPCFTISLLVEPQPRSLCGEAALTTHKDSSFLGPAGPQLSSKCVGLLPNPSPAFPQSSASWRANWVPWCSWFNHTPVSSVPHPRSHVLLSLLLSIFVPWGNAACLMKSARSPAPQASLIRLLCYDKLLNNIIYFSWDIAREGYVSLPAETGSMMDETSGNIILADCLSFNIKHTVSGLVLSFSATWSPVRLKSFLWCN